MKALPNGKSPGPDGYSKAYYAKFLPLLQNHMCRYFNSLATNHQIPPEALLAHITVLPKEGKDPTLPQSYRPISLLNVDIKIFAKIMANRLKHVLPSFIHPDQTGFISGREARDNSIRAIQLIQWACSHKNSTPYLILSTDAEKAFDRIDWSYLKAVLEAWGLGPHMLRWIMALYSTPSAKVKVNGHLSLGFPIRNGTRQGCPLSPLLFALALEPLLRTIRANSDIRGVTVGSTEHKLSAYADDVLFHLTQPLVSLPNLMRELKSFGHVSNFKINFSKSEILPITIPIKMATGLQQTFPFSWAKTSIKYLGIQLTNRFDTIYSANFPTLLSMVRRDLQNWTKTSFTWLGKLNILKMNILPRVLFYLQMLPVTLPRSFFAQLQSLMINFIWHGKKPRLAVSLLQKAKEIGGLGLPDIRRYYRAIAIQHILNWRHHGGSKMWVSLEKSLAGRDLSYAPWLSREHRGLSQTTSPLTNHILRVWDRTNALCALVPPGSPLAPLGGYKWFPPGEQRTFFGTWVSDGNYSYGKFVDKGKLIPLDALRNSHGRFPMDWWRHQQLQHFIATEGTPMRGLDNITTLESLFIEEEPTPHLISELYRLLGSVPTAGKPAFIREWERDLGVEFTPEQRLHMYKLAHSSSIESRTQETNYKLLTRWYRVPAAIARIYPSVSDRCWRGCDQKGTLLHVWWECPVIRSFWMEVQTTIKNALQIEIPFSPEHFLLHLPTLPLSHYKKSALPHLLNAAKRLIPLYWKRPQVPTLKEWLQKVDDIREAEEWVARCKDRSERFDGIWAQWRRFTIDTNPVSSSIDVALLELAEPSLKLRRPVGGDVRT